MARRCPHCAAIIEHVNFTQNTVGYESGQIDEYGNWNTRNSEITDTDALELTCPECDTRLHVDSAWIEGEDDNVYVDDDECDDITGLESDKTNSDEWTNLV